MYEKVRIREDGFRDERRVVIIDYQHLAYKYMFGSKPLSIRLDKGNGLTELVDTTIPAYTIKNIVSLSHNYMNYVCVCMDSPLLSRKEAFQREIDSTGLAELPYKGSREHTNKGLFRGIQLTQQLLKQGGVQVLNKMNYEADDLVFAAVCKAKRDFPDLPIDVITNDWDYAPMADEQVSVYIRSVKRTLATTGPKINKYVQVTPDTYEELANETSAFKNLYVPYNTVLLWKILRGDKSDDISPMKKENGRNKWTPLKVKALIEGMEYRGLLDEHTFAYKDTPTKVLDKSTGIEYPSEVGYAKIAHKEIDKNNCKMIIGKPLYLEEMEDSLEAARLEDLIDQEDYDFIMNRFSIMNLNGAFLDTKVRRAPFTFLKPFRKIDMEQLQSAIDYLDIHLRRI